MLAIIIYIVVYRYAREFIVPPKKPISKGKPGRPVGATPPKATIIAGRFSADEASALQKYAADDRRAAATALRMIVTDFLREKGYLKG
jgi:hypothetical protein